MKHLTFLCLLCLPLSLFAAPDVAQLRKDVGVLAADALEGRGIGTKGLDSAASYIAQRMAQIGLDPAL
ncbi:MAG: hypothetical protein IPH10_08245 [bacterium]|nr:hypothetical protein [bacterium]